MAKIFNQSWSGLIGSHPLFSFDVFGHMSKNRRQIGINTDEMLNSSMFNFFVKKLWYYTTIVVLIMHLNTFQPSIDNDENMMRNFCALKKEENSVWHKYSPLFKICIFFFSLVVETYLSELLVLQLLYNSTSETNGLIFYEKIKHTAIQYLICIYS